jgi:toxin ParE1/3/4
MKYTVRLGHAAQRDINALLDYLVPVAGAEVARAYVGRLQAFLRTFERLPERGSIRNEIREGLRVVGFERRMTIAFSVDGNVVTIVRVLYAGRQFTDDEQSDG